MTRPALFTLALGVGVLAAAPLIAVGAAWTADWLMARNLRRG